MSEDNVRAARMMISAADTIHQSIVNLDAIMERQQRFLDDWLARYEAMLEKSMPPKPEPEPAPAEPSEPYPNSWEPWYGGFPPISTSKGLWVWIKTKGGVVTRMPAGDVQWRHYKERFADHQVVAWQPATPPS